MSDIDEVIAGGLAQRKAELAAAVEAVQMLEPDQPRYTAAFARLEQAGAALLSFEGQIPALYAEQRRKDVDFGSVP